MKRKSMLNGLSQETINKFIKAASLEASNSSSNRFRSINKNIGQEFKNQFNSKQSFKKLYSNNRFFPSSRPPMHKNSWHKNKKLKEGYLRGLLSRHSRIKILPIIETRLDIVVCRLGWANSLNEAHSLIRANIIKVNSQYSNIVEHLPSVNSRIQSDYSKFFLPIGSVIEKVVERKIIRNNVNYLLIHAIPNPPSNNEAKRTDSKWLEKVTLMRYPSEKEILKLWVQENQVHNSLSYNIMVLIDKLNLQT